jgi:TonB family protein
MGGVLEATVDASGQVIDWRLNKSSGWIEFDQQILQSAQSAGPFPPAPLTGQPVEIPFAYRAEATKPTLSERYSLGPGTPPIGSHILRKDVTNISVPPAKSYAELTDQEKNTVKSVYEPMPDGDEPPYPLHGTIGMIRAISKLQNHLAVEGSLVLAADINENGDATRVEALKSPDPEMTKLVATILMLQKYKPAICGGVPCTMQYPIRVDFSIAH